MHTTDDNSHWLDMTIVRGFESASTFEFKLTSHHCGASTAAASAIAEVYYVGGIVITMQLPSTSVPICCCTISKVVHGQVNNKTMMMMQHLYPPLVSRNSSVAILT